MKRLFVAGILALSASVAVFAQDFKTGYFLDNYVYGYRINPGAPVGDETYTFFSVGLGNISAEARSNLSMASFLNSSRDAWIIDSSVSPSEALSGFSENNSLGLNANVNILTFGRETDHNRFSIELNARSDSYFNLPLSAISSVKGALDGLATDVWPSSYNFSDLILNANAYTEIAFGYTHKIGDQLTIGGRIKGLVGFASVNADIAADVSIINQKTPLETVNGKLSGNLDIASPMDMGFKTYDKGGEPYIDLYGSLSDPSFLPDAFANKHRHITGWGAGVDLGVTYEPVDGLTLSLSALDLGVISWERTHGGQFCFDESILTDTESDNTLGKRILSLKATEGGRNAIPLNYTIHAGAKYRMPFYDKWSVGLLGTLQQHNKEVRLGTDITPIDFLSLAGSFGIGTYGADFGLALNINLPFLDFFVGTDAIVLPSGPVKPIYGTKVNSLLTTGLVITIR